MRASFHELQNFGAPLARMHDMKLTLSFRLAVTLTVLVPLLLLGRQLAAAEAAPAATAADDPRPTYLLRYKFAPGEAIRWKVVHLGTTETKISGNTQTSRSRSVSTKLWQVQDLSADGDVTFTHSVENVDMWQQISDRPEVSYDSTKDAKAPLEYQQVAETIGRPLTTVTINAHGEILKKDTDSPRVNFGLGDIVMLLPPKPVHAGSRWYEPAELQVRHPEGRVERIKIRKLYTLDKVQTGVATIQVKTEVLTPISEARIQAQLVQQLTNGTIKFDIDAGRVLAKQIDWDESVLGFNGAESMMKYLARFTEELLTANTPVATTPPARPANPAPAGPTARANPAVPRR